MKLCGLHLPNRNFVDDDWPRIQKLGVQHYVDLQHFQARWSWIKNRQSNACIHAREDVRGPLGDPRQEAEGLFKLIQEHGTNVATWRRRNEPNLRGELENVAPGQWREWLADFGKAIKQLAPNTRVYAPAVSPGTPDWLAWLDATVGGASLGGLDGLDVHAYGNPAEVRAVLEQTHSRWNGPLLVTEHNFGAGRPYDLARFAADLPAVLSVCAEFDAEAACLFIWQWATPDMSLPTTVDVKGTPVEQVIATLPDQERVPNIPSTSNERGGTKGMPLDKDKLGLYGEWSKQRLGNDQDPRDVIAFIDHLRMINADWRVPHEYGLPYLNISPKGW